MHIFDELSLTKLKAIIKAYNLHTKIVVSKRTKAEIIIEMKKHLMFDKDGKLCLVDKNLDDIEKAVNSVEVKKAVKKAKEEVKKEAPKPAPVKKEKPKAEVKKQVKEVEKITKEMTKNKEKNKKLQTKVEEIVKKIPEKHQMLLLENLKNVDCSHLVVKDLVGTEKEKKKQYLAQALILHPDKNPKECKEEAEKAFQKLSKIYHAEDDEPKPKKRPDREEMSKFVKKYSELIRNNSSKIFNLQELYVALNELYKLKKKTDLTDADIEKWCKKYEICFTSKRTGQKNNEYIAKRTKAEFEHTKKTFFK
jgi:hypothetical protein